MNNWTYKIESQMKLKEIRRSIKIDIHDKIYAHDNSYRFLCIPQLILTDYHHHRPLSQFDLILNEKFVNITENVKNEVKLK